MPKFYGNIGYLMTVETEPGIWTEQLVERSYYGDLTRLAKNTSNDNHLNDEVRLSSTFSIVADPYAYANFSSMKYIVYMGIKLKIESVDPTNPPRLVIQAGGKYNDPSDADYGHE